MSVTSFLPQRKLGPFDVSAVGLGCMGLSYGYGTPPDRESAQGLLHMALETGYTHLDTATMYGGGANEELIGETLSERRDEFILASKCGLYPGRNAPREIDGRPERIRKACEDSLRRLRTEVIDLYYLHRLDRNVPIEESVGAMAELVAEGKIRAIGLSEMSADTIRRAHGIHPIAALQSEYSLWTRNAEIAVLDLCRELRISFVAFSPLGRGFLTGRLKMGQVEHLGGKDIRRHMPRFAPETFRRNLSLLDPVRALAAELDCSLPELAIAWVLSRAPHIVAIPGTTNPKHLVENARGARLQLNDETIERLDRIINERTVVGSRYSDAQQADIDTEEFTLPAAVRLGEQRAGQNQGA